MLLDLVELDLQLPTELPWEVDDCERRYVFGKRVSLEELAKLSGLSFSTLSKASTAGDWKNKRTKHRETVTEVIQQQILNSIRKKVADTIDIDVDRIEQEHFNTAQALRQLVTETITSQLSTLMTAKQLDFDEYLSLIQQQDPAQFQKLSIVLKNCVDIERVSTHADVRQLQFALQVVLQHGYVVKEPDPNHSSN